MVRVGALLVAALAVGCSTPSTSPSADTPDTEIPADSGPPLETHDAAIDAPHDAGLPAIPDAGVDGGIRANCFPLISDIDGPPRPDYDQYHPIVSATCRGTHQQRIEGVEQVVFLGDSVTVGTPDTKHPVSIDNAHFYRNLLAEELATHFNLPKGDSTSWSLWKAYDYTKGTGALTWSGAFGNCAKWGARTDDLIEGEAQAFTCLPSGGSDKKTLFVFTMGGNDIAKVSQEGGSASEDERAAGYPQEWALAQRAVQFLDEALGWMTNRTHFPNGSYVVMANPYEFTDGTGFIDSCPAAGIAGLSTWKDIDVQRDIIAWMAERYTALAVKYQTDVVWSLESFCGHGYVATASKGAPLNACWLGPNTPLWFDETCIHPSEAGHKAMYELFKGIIEEP